MNDRRTARPLVHILTTGGTIDKVYFDAKSTYTVGEPQIGAILTEAGVGFPFFVDVLLQKDSLDMTEDDRALIAEAVASSEARHVLVTHGTDTMADTARVVQERLSTDSGKTVVFVGSLTPARFRSTDAEFNIGFATAAVQALASGVYVAMNGMVFTPDKVRKNREANRFELA